VFQTEAPVLKPHTLRPLLAVARVRAKKRRAISGDGLERQLRDSLAKLDVSRTWSRFQFLPKDLKWVLISIPFIVAIWVGIRPGIRSAPSNPPHTPAPVVTAQLAAEKAGQATAEAGSSTWKAVEDSIASRASVDLQDDFRSGIASWEGRGDWSRSWSYNKSGVVTPGAFAVYAPSVRLADYVAEIKASIQKRSLQWGIRASDPANYHAFRLTASADGAYKIFHLERWAVVNGKSGPVRSVPIAPQSRVPEILQIRAEAIGDSISTYLNDSVVDTFSDPRLPTGGVALFAAAGDRPSIYSIRVTHQNDFLGKLCSFLAPQPIANQGSK
jgi:hypothetical protein